MDDAAESSGARQPMTMRAKGASEDGDWDYVVNLKAESKDVVFFPEFGDGPQLRRLWYMRRRRRPMVPAPSHTPMPDKQPDGEGKARLFALYLRPSVLDRRFATAEVPHLADLDVVPSSVPTGIAVSRRRLRGKCSLLQAPRRSFQDAWRWYVRGHVVSQHAKRIIVQFMAACCGKTKSDQHPDAELDNDAQRSKEVPPNSLPLGRVHAVLDRMSQDTDGTRAEQASAANDVADDEGGEDERALRQSSHIRGAMQRTAKLWSRESKPWPEEPTDVRSCSLPQLPNAAHRQKHKRQKQKQDKANPKAQQARAYVDWKEDKVAAWLQSVRQRPHPPTAEQEAFLSRVIDRCRQEHGELGRTFDRRDGARSLSEPARDCLFGIPGAGKSTCLKLLREFFEDCLGWEDGVQFQFLASQNTMAALIGGTTVHSWGTIPVNATDAASKMATNHADGDVDELFLKALGIRWLVFDESSTLSPSLLGLLDAYLRRACTRHPYARRDGARRPFGGINLLLAGDLWQLPPVFASAIFSNPFKAGYSFEEQKIFNMFWRKDADSIQWTFLLT